MSLAEAESWLIAQVRGNNRSSNDKTAHRVCMLLETHFGIARPTSPTLRNRLQNLADHADKIGPRGRACLVGCYALRMPGDDFWIWRLIEEARAP